MGGSESNVRGLLGQYADGNGPDEVTVLANRHVMEPYARFERGPVRLHHVSSYRPGDSQPTRLAAMAGARVAPGLAARDVPAGLDVVHYPVTVPIPRTPAPSVVTVHDVQHHELPALFSRAERAYRSWAYDDAARGADVLVTSSEYSRDRLVELVGADPGRTEVVRMGVDHDRFRPDPGAEDGSLLEPLGLPERYVVYPANLWPHKNHERLLEGLALACDEELGVALTGQTYGRLDALMEKARQLGVERRVHHLGFLPSEAVPALFRRARAMVFPSLYEGFGAPPLEAMACGAPVAASLRASLAEACAGAVAEIDPEDPRSIAAGIDTVSGDEDERARLRAAGLERAARFTWEEAARRHTEICSRVAGRN